MFRSMTVKKDRLMEFVNFVSECCEVMDNGYVSEWLNKPNPDLNMKMPIEVFNNEGTERLYRLLYFIDIGEADLN